MNGPAAVPAAGHPFMTFTHSLELEAAMPMNELTSAGLFGLGLVEIGNPAMARRYNECLEHLGLPKTRKRKFKIDRMGWSPEIAEELGDEYYLSHGPANPYAIIVMPEQRHAPIYYPYHSFDWNLLDSWFDTNWPQVVEITKRTGICLDLDQSVDVFRGPEDLLLVTDIVTRASTPSDLMDAARRQRMLVRGVLDEPDGYFDGELITGLLESRAAHGDLRGLRLIINDGHFADVADFYSRAFGGVFVLRSLGEKPLVYCRDSAEAEGHVKVKPVDEACREELLAHGYVTSDIGWWRDHLWRLRIIQESFLMDVLDEEEPELEFWSLSGPKQKGVIRRFKDQLDPYLEIGEIVRQLEMGSEPDSTPEHLRVHLLHPASDLNDASQRVVWHLLTFLSGGRNVVRYYRHQKTAFIDSYTNRWKVPKREWARLRVREYYEHASNTHQQT